MALSDSDLEELPALAIQVAGTLIGRVGLPQDVVEECTSDVVSDLCERRDQFEMRGTGALRAYLTVRIKGCVLNKLKVASHHIGLEGADGQELPVPQPMTEGRFEILAEGMRQLVTQCGAKDALTCELQQECQLLMMIYVEDLGIENVAKILGWSKSTVHRAKESCRAGLIEVLRRENELKGGPL